ncbi:MAG: hypothetical protein K2K44_00925 [Oscillospiraceae bacterium]|nr:hypothetical protein [Oscillospiraceae bacterium]
MNLPECSGIVGYRPSFREAPAEDGVIFHSLLFFPKQHFQPRLFQRDVRQFRQASLLFLN